MAGTEDVPASTASPLLRSIIMSRVAQKFHTTLKGARIKINGDLSDPNCVIRMGRFEFGCKGIMTTVAQSKNVIEEFASKSSPTNSSSRSDTSVIIIAALATLLLISILCSAFYFLIFKSKSSRYIDESQSVCEPTTSSV